MAIFNGAVLPATQTYSVPANTATQIYNTSTFNSVSFPTTATLTNLIVTNNSSAANASGTIPTISIGLTSGVTTTLGVPLAPSQSLVINGSVIVGSASWNLYAITLAGSATATVECSLGTLVSVA